MAGDLYSDEKVNAMLWTEWDTASEIKPFVGSDKCHLKKIGNH